MRAGRLGFRRVAGALSSRGSFADSLVRRVAEEQLKQKSLFVNHPRRLGDRPQKSIFK